MLVVLEIHPSIKQTKFQPPYFAKSLALHAMGLGRGWSNPPSAASVAVLLVAIDYFTKWVKAVPLYEVTSQQISKFLWQNTVCHFRLSQTIISDNGTNIASKQVANFYSKYKIAHLLSTPNYFQGNGQVEISNRIILDRLCKSLGKAKGKWVEIPGVLWVY